MLGHHNAVALVEVRVLDLGQVALADKIGDGLDLGIAGRTLAAFGRRRGGSRCAAVLAAQQAPEQEHCQDKDDHQRHRHNFAGADLVVAAFKHGVGNVRVGQGAHQLRHRLHTARRVQPQSTGQHLGEPGRHACFQAVGGFQAVAHFALRRGHRRLARDHLVADRCQRVDIGIAAAELSSRILLRRGIAGVKLAFQLTAAGAQRQRAVTGQPGRAIDGQQDIIRADAAVDQPRFVQQRHTLHHRLQQGAGLGGGQGAAAQAQVMRQGHALFAFFDGVDGVVFFHHVQNRVQTSRGGQIVQVVVQILKIHPAGFKKHFFPVLGHQRTVGAAAIAEGDREILFDEDELFFFIQDTAVGQAVTVGA